MKTILRIGLTVSALTGTGVLALLEDYYFAALVAGVAAGTVLLFEGVFSGLKNATNETMLTPADEIA